MPRKGPSARRRVEPDTLFGSQLVTRFVNKLLKAGKKTRAEEIMYGALQHIQEQSGQNPLEVLRNAVRNTMPSLEVKPRRVGGATYQVPVETSPERQLSLALRWIVDLANNRKGVAFERALAQEIRDAAAGQGNAVKKRDETHRMAQANRAFAHLRW